MMHFVLIGGELIKNNYKFHGYDFYEIVECFWDDLKHDDLADKSASETEKIMVERLVQYLFDNFEHSSVVLKVREFIDALCHMGEKYDFNGRYMWEGLRQTKHDLTFIQYLTDCIYRLWN